MKRLIILIFSFFLFAANINTTKKEIIKTQQFISKMNKKLDILANEIYKKEKNLKQISNKINILNNQINILEEQLKNSNKKLSDLIKLKQYYKQKANKIEDEIVNFISENYFLTTLKTENINDLINKEISKKILNKYSKKINSLIQQNKQISLQINLINREIDLILNKKNQLKQKKLELSNLLKNQKRELAILNQKKEIYKRKLQNLINRQKMLQKKLAQLNVIKKPNKNITVRKVGSSYFKPQITNYNGPKTIAPINGKIIKHFGSYIDPVYKIRVYNDSITIKPYKPNSVVRSILGGRVVYIGESNGKKIIVIRHKNKLFSIYANLDKISPILKKGSFVKRGQIIARVKNSLEFEVTYKEKPINPVKIISIK